MFEAFEGHTTLAMPESRIGFFPDVGASYFLPRLPHRAGYWLALTAASVKGHEAVCTGLATHYVASDRFAALHDALPAALQALDGKEESTDAAHEAITQTLQTFSAPFPDDSYNATMTQRARWFAETDLQSIHARLTEASQNANTDATHLLSLLDSGSPYSTKITLQLFSDASNKDLQQCLALELALAAEAVRFPDCAEGVRSVLVDKDRNPEWQAT
ncbi:MAG: enoyl-CoA hydratase/isomerase family protein [Granulosicoccus sp.]